MSDDLAAALLSKTITISKKEYDQLKRDSLFLEALRQGGVDNWDWYSDACELFTEWQGEEA